MNKEIFKLNAIVEQDPLDDNLMSMVMGGNGSGSCIKQIVICCLFASCHDKGNIEPCKGNTGLLG